MSQSSSDLASPDNEYDRTILVSGIPEGVTKNRITIHFQRRKNGGGEVKNVTLLTGGEAVVVFEDPKVAKVVVNTQQIFNENVLEVRRLDAEKSRGEEIVGRKEARTVFVSRLPEEATENSVYIHFQKKKNGGGEVENVKMLGEGKAVVLFEEPAVAKQVVATKQKIKGKAVHVELVVTKTYPNAETSEEHEISKQESAVLVSGLPEGVTENGVHIHFQKKKNGGGEIKKVRLLPEKNEAIVIFESLEVAERVVVTEQFFKGKVLIVKLQSSETSPTIEKSEKESTEKARTIVVTDLPEGATENSVHIHFQKKKNGGGEVEKVVVLPGNTALVVFQHPEVARRIVTTQQEMKGKALTINFLNNKESSPEVRSTPEVKRASELKMQPEVTTPEVKAEETTTVESVGSLETERTPVAELKPEERRQMEERATAAGISLDAIDPVFSMVTATVNPMLMNTGSQFFWTDLFNIVQRTCGVQCQISAYGVLLTGSLNQVTRARELLELQWRKHCQDLQLRNIDHHNLVNQSDPNFYHGDTSFNQSDMSINQGGTNFNPGGTNFNQVVTNFNQSGTNFNQGGMNFNHGGMNFNQGGTNFNPGGTNLNPGGTNLNPGGTNFNPGGTNFNPGGTNFNPGGTNFNQGDTNFNQGGTNFNQGGTNFNPGGTNLNPGGTNFNQGGTNFNPGGTNFNPGDTNFNQGGTNFDQGGTNFNQGDTSFCYHGTALNQTATNVNQSNTHFNQSGTHFPERGTALNQHAPSFNQHSMTNSMGSSFGRQEFVSSGHSFDARPESQYSQQNINYSLHQGNQQSGRNGEESPNGTGPGSASSYTGELGPHFGHRDMRNLNQPPDAKQPPGFVETTANLHSCGNSPNISPYAGEIDHSSVQPRRSSVDTARSICASELDPCSAEPPRSTDNTRVPQPCYNPSNHPPPGYVDKSLNSTIMEGDQASGCKTDPPGAKPASSQDSTKPPQPLRYDENGTSTDSPTGTESITPNVFPPGKTKVTAMPENSLEGTTIPQPPVNNQHSITPNSSTGPESSTASSHLSVSPSNDKTNPRSEKPPISPRSSINHQTPVKNEQNTTPNPLTGPKSLTTPSNQFESSSNDKTDSRSESPPTLPKSTANHQLSVNHDESTTLNTAPGTESLTNSSNPLGLGTSSEKPPGFPESTTNLLPTGSDQQATMTEPNTGPQNLNNSSNQTGTPSNEKPTSLGKQPDSSDRTIKLQPLDNDQLQKSTTSNTATELQNSTTTVPSTNTPDSLTGKPHNAGENAPNNRPQHNQQQTTPNQQTSTPDITNTETSDKSSVSKLGEKPRSSTDPNNKPQRKTPIPLPRQNKLGTGERRQNAANFSSPVKATQARQGSPAPIEPNNNSVNDKPTAATNLCEKGDENSTKPNEVNDHLLDELD